MIVIEHHLDVIKNADWVIDLGPEGGDAGGEVIGEGTPEHLATLEHSATGRFLRETLAKHHGAAKDGAAVPARRGRRASSRADGSDGAPQSSDGATIASATARKTRRAKKAAPNAGSRRTA